MGWRGGGVLVNQAPHQLDLLLWYMGELEEVFGYWGNLNHPYIEVEDTAVAVAKVQERGLGKYCAQQFVQSRDSRQSTSPWKQWSLRQRTDRWRANVRGWNEQN